MKKQLYQLWGWPSESNFLLADDVADLESLLQSQLTPIAARPTFVHDLRKRLSKEIDPALQKRQRAQQQSSLWQRIFLMAAGILSGVVLILLGVRAIISIIATLAMRQQARRIF